MSLPYFDGKRRQAPWIASLLPERGCYVEPYAGMLSVLLVRPKARSEIVSDLDDNVWNWWRCVRDHGDEMARRLHWTPVGRSEFDEARRLLFDEPHGSAKDVERAVAFHVFVTLGRRGQTRRDGRFALRHAGRPLSFRWEPDRFEALRERIADVQLECRPAVDLLESSARVEDAAIYVDPPSATSRRGHEVHELDRDELADVLRRQKGFVALSGHPEDGWDMLPGWFRHETAGGPCVWTNRPVEKKAA